MIFPVFRHALRIAVALGLMSLAACTTARPSRPPILNPVSPIVPPPPVVAPAPPPAGAETQMQPVNFSDLQGWNGADHRNALLALRRSCIAILNKAADAPLGGAGYAGRVIDWRYACRASFTANAAEVDTSRRYFEDWFAPVRLGQFGAQGLFTGYFEPQLHGSRTRHDQYQTPIYGVPADLVRIDGATYRDTAASESFAGRVMMSMMMMRYVPYPARAEIERDGIPAKPLFYVDDAIDAFFLQVQGSGRVALDDGSVVRAAYAGQNGQPYTAIGAVLLQRGELTREEVSLQSIKAWLLAHPDQAQDVMNANESFVFFVEQRIGEPQAGATGAEGVALTPGASLAVDPSFHAYGTPVWLEGTAPDPDPANPDRLLQRLLIAQDTGGAIRGGLRGDVYWGFGADAASVAGRMKNNARMTVLLPKAVVARMNTRAGAPTS